MSRKYIRFIWEGNLYEFLCLCFGLGPAPLIFTKLMKIPISVLRKLNVRVYNCFSRRHVDGNITGRTYLGTTNNDIYFGKSGICDKSKEITTRTSPKNRISGVDHRFSLHDTSSPNRKNFKNSKSMCTTFTVTKNQYHGINKTDRIPIYHNSGCDNSKAPTSLSTTAANTSPEQISVLSDRSDSEQTILGRATVVEGKPNSSEWETSSVNRTRIGNTNRCIQNWVGSSLPGNINWGKMVSARTEKTYKCIGVIAQ